MARDGRHSTQHGPPDSSAAPAWPPESRAAALDVSRDGTLLVFSDFLDGRLRTYDVPPTETLLAGNGGYYQAHLREVRKDGKPFVRGTASSSGD